MAGVAYINNTYKHFQPTRHVPNEKAVFCSLLFIWQKIYFDNVIAL